MTIDNTNAQFSSQADSDKVIHAKVLTYTIQPGVAGSRQTFTYDPGLNDSAFPLGIYTFDGGSTYNDLGDVIPSGGTFVIGSALLPTYYVIVKDALNGIITFQVVLSVGSASSVSLTIYLLLLPYLGMPTIPLPTTIAGTQAMNKFTANKYRNIDFKSGYGGAFPSTIAHNLGAVPSVAFWFSRSGAYQLLSTYNGNPIAVNQDAIKVDSTNIILSGLNLSTTVYVQLYKDS